MNFPSFIQAFPKLASVAGGLALVIGIPILGFALLTASAVINLISAFKERKRSDLGFFSAWACMNTWFIIQSGGH